MEQATNELLAAHRAYMDDWNYAIAQKKPELVTRHVSKDFFGTFVGGAAATVEVLNWESYTGGLAQAALGFPEGTTWQVDVYHAAMRTPTEGIILSRSAVCGGAELISEVWRKEADGWRILRCYEEVL